MIFKENKIIQFYKINSTNDYASKVLSEKNIEEGSIIWALNQTEGRGQKGNKWESEISKNLTFSIILKPNKILPVKQFYLNMAVSLSLVDFLKSIITNRNIYIKWPNDIYVDNKKIAGILIENQIIANEIENSIIGIGLNVNQNKFSENIPNPTSLKILESIDYELRNLLVDFLYFIENRIQQLYKFEFDNLKLNYITSLLYFGELKQFKYKNEIINARIIDINTYGKLILKSENQMVIECDLKEIEFIHS